MPRFPFIESLAARVLSPVLGELREDVYASESHLSVLREEIQEARLAVAEAEGASGGSAGWRETNATTQKGEPKRAELRVMHERSRALALRNPLTKRGIAVQSFYTFGRGFSLSSPHDGAKKALSDFTKDPDNLWLFQAWSAAALDRELAIHGNLFFAFFTTPQTGRVVVRLFDVDQIEDVHRAPSDKGRTHFYERVYEKEVTEHGRTFTRTVHELYPDYKHNPASKPREIDGKLVNWDVKVLHVKTGGLNGWKFGVPENWAGQDWAKGYSNFLQDRATVAKALAQFSLKVTRAISDAAKALGAKARPAATRAPEGSGGAGPGLNAAGRTTDPNSKAGNTANLGPGTNLEAVTVKGATIDPDEGRRLSLMVYCDAGLPEIYYGDVSVGSRATGESMDWPTKLMFELRQNLYVSVLGEAGFFALKAAAYAKLNAFSATFGLDGFSPVLKGQDGKPIEIKVVFPPLLEHNVKERTDAIDKAAKYLPGAKGKKLVARLMLTTLGEENVDATLEELDFSQPDTPKPPASGAAPGATQPATKDPAQPAPAA